MATCIWPIDIADCCKDTGLDPEENEGDAEKVESVIEQVSEMLSLWSGYAFGGCQTIRPLSPCGECRSGCCVSGDCIVLHNASTVSEIRILGEVVSPAQYNFDAERGILCAVPPMTWPRRDPRFESVGVLEVDVMVGAEPDAWALAVANELACEFLRSCAGKKCRIPGNATTITSQGITINLTRDEVLYALPSVVSWVNAMNPERATRPARILSPEARRQRVMGVRF